MGIGLKNAKRHIHNIDHFFDNGYFKKAKQDLAKFTIESMVGRTTAGQGERESLYKPYSKSYGKQKAKKYPGKGWLSASGKALGVARNPRNFSFVVGKDKITIKYNGPDYMVYHQKGEGKMPRRKWFTLNRTHTREGIIKRIHMALKASAVATSSGRRL